MAATSTPPSSFLQATATPSRPISIADKRITSASKERVQLASSCPVSVFLPPPAPSSRPRLASIDPPPMELPPSPPVVSALAFAHVAARKSSIKPRRASSRAMPFLASSAPVHAMGLDQKMIQEEEEDDLELDDDSLDSIDEDEDIELEQHSPKNFRLERRLSDCSGFSAESFSKSPTIFSVLKQDADSPPVNTKSSSGLTAALSHMSLRSKPIPTPSTKKQQTRPQPQDDDDLQFSFSFDERGDL